jgi:heterodisulfide reductase subunit B
MPINYKNYHPKWSLIRRLILKRAKNHCEECGIQNHTYRKGKVIFLTIAHLDHNVLNNKFNNLKAMCQRCHLNYDKNYHARSRKYGKDHRKDQLGLF